MLYECHRTSEIVATVKEQLRKHHKSITTFFADFLRAIHKSIIEWAERRGLGLTRNLSAVEQEYELCVPQVWTPTSTKLLMEAVRLAGLPRTEFVYESQAAAAFSLEHLKHYLQENQIGLQEHDIFEDDEMMVADLGGGTGDFASYKFGSDTDAGAEVALYSVGQPEGALCGSEFVNRQFLAWLNEECPEVKEIGNIRKARGAAGLTKINFEAQASAEFETLKVLDRFPKSRTITINGTKKGKFFRFEVSEDIIKKCFDPIIDEVITIINRHLTPQTKVIFIPGGFGHSKYLLEKLNAVFSPEDGSSLGRTSVKIWDGFRIPGTTYSPIPTGELLRHRNIAHSWHAHAVCNRRRSGRGVGWESPPRRFGVSRVGVPR